MTPRSRPCAANFSNSSRHGPHSVLIWQSSGGGNSRYRAIDWVRKAITEFLLFPRMTVTTLWCGAVSWTQSSPALAIDSCSEQSAEQAQTIELDGSATGLGLHVSFGMQIGRSLHSYESLGSIFMAVVRPKVLHRSRS